MGRTKITRDWKLRKKIIVTLLAALVLVLSALTIVLSMHQKQVLLGELDKKGENLARFVGAISSEPIMSYNFNYLENYVRDIALGDKDIVYAVILGKDNNPLTRRAQEAPDKKRIREFSSNVLQGSEKIGTVKIGFSTAAVDKALFDAQVIIAAVSACTLILIAGTAYVLFGIAALRPVERLKKVMEAVADGDLTVGADGENRDEIGDLGRRINETIASLAALIGQIKSSFGNITAVSDGIYATSEQLSASSRETASTAETGAKNNESAAAAVEQTSATMQEMSARIQQVARNAQNQSASMSGTSASIAQMTEAITSVANTAERLLALSQAAKKTVVLGFEAVHKSNKNAEEISKAINRSGTSISALGSRAQDIGKIVDVIDGIAEQTNLLALNAAIEAARAGEQGMGFAVVAEEVRKLAERCAVSTREIGDLISAMQQDAQQAVTFTEKTSEIVQLGLDSSRQVGDALKEINRTVEEVDSCATLIGSAIREQKTGSSRIVQAVGRVREMAREIAVATEEQASGAEQIAGTMEKLRTTLHQTASGSVALAAAAQRLRAQGADELAASAKRLRTEADGFRAMIGKFRLDSRLPGRRAAGKEQVECGEPASGRVLTSVA